MSRRPSGDHRRKEKAFPGSAATRRRRFIPSRLAVQTSVPSDRVNATVLLSGDTVAISAFAAITAVNVPCAATIHTILRFVAASRPLTAREFSLGNHATWVT